MVRTPSSLLTPAVLRIEIGSNGDGQEYGAGDAPPKLGLSRLARGSLDERGAGAKTSRDGTEILDVVAFDGADTGSSDGSSTNVFLKRALRQPATLSRPRCLGARS